jgi:hypothetical protein
MGTFLLPGPLRHLIDVADALEQSPHFTWAAFKNCLIDRGSRSRL